MAVILTKTAIFVYISDKRIYMIAKHQHHSKKHVTTSFFSKKRPEDLTVYCVLKEMLCC